MSMYSFKVNMDAKAAYELVKADQNSELVYEEIILEGEDFVGIIIFEKYFMRVSNRAALTVIVDNTNGVTNIKAISTGSSQGMFFNFDWGASDDFANSVINTFERYIIE